MTHNRFMTYLKPEPPRYLSRLDLFLRFIENKVNDAIVRSTHTSSNSYGIRVLTEIIKLSDLKTILPMYMSGKLSSSYLLSITKDLEQPIDVRNGRQGSSFFIKSKTMCYELITASRRDNPLGDIPYGKDYDNSEWKAIRPFRIYDISACDLVYTAHGAHLYYTGDGPKYVIYTVDCFALLCKFLAYYKAAKYKDDVDTLIQEYLHKDVVIPNLLRDSASIWMRNNFRNQFLIGSPLESRSMTLWDNINGDTLGADYTGAMYDVHHLKKDVISGSVTPLVGMSSLQLSRNTGFTQYYTELFENNKGSITSSHLWVECLKNLPWWEFITLINATGKALPETQMFEKDVIRDVRFWKMLRPWNSVHGSLPYRAIVETRLTSLYDYLKGR